MALVSNGTFKGILIGDHCSITINYNRNVEKKKIPRANGTIIRNTGGGWQEIFINAWVIKTTRQDVEDYCNNLALSFGNAPGTLIVNGTSYTNCFFMDITPSQDDVLYNNFTMTLIRNPY